MHFLNILKKISGFVGLQRVLSATCAAVAEFNSGVEVTMRRLCDIYTIKGLLEKHNKHIKQVLRCIMT